MAVFLFLRVIQMRSVRICVLIKNKQKSHTCRSQSVAHASPKRNRRQRKLVVDTKAGAINRPVYAILYIETSTQFGYSLERDSDNFEMVFFFRGLDSNALD